jgi:hypothetical protein
VTYGKRTYTGRVVYDRPRHKISAKDCFRFIRAYDKHYNERFPDIQDQEAITVRAIYRYAKSLYAGVRHFFEPDIRDPIKSELKRGVKKFTTQVVDGTAQAMGQIVAALTGNVSGEFVEGAIKYFGYLYDDFIEGLFTGSVTVRKGEENGTQKEDTGLILQ